jgi:type II secretory ATPase GspE/PulE/Tfp pilus assembly ATPase PilB-like protein
VTGPTGSGKTTTLYAALGRVLARGGVNVITVEDPVERRLPGVVQVQTHERPGSPSRRAARHPAAGPGRGARGRGARPRDRGRGGAGGAHRPPRARHAAHVDAVGAVSRLADVGVEPFKLAAALRGVVAQRLVRRLCGRLSRPVAPGWTDAASSAAPRTASRPGRRPPRVSPTEPCDACAGAGYQGRVPALEVLLADSAFAAPRGGGRRA